MIYSELIIKLQEYHFKLCSNWPIKVVGTHVFLLSSFLRSSLYYSLNSPTPLVQVPMEPILNLKLKETKRGEKSICHLSVVPRATSYTNFLFRRKKEIERSQHQQIKRDLTKKKKVEKRESSSTFIF